MAAEWHEENLQLFWHWIAQRQRAFYRRHALRAPPPWCDDPIVAGNHFTNVYRELDPGTKWVVRQVHMNPRLHLSEIVFLNVAYRLFGTEEVFEALGITAKMGPVHPMLPDQFDEDWLAKQLQGRMDAGLTAFTPAYMVSNYGRAQPKPVVIANVLAQAATHWDETFHALRWPKAQGRRAAWAALNTVYGVGRFLAFQVLVDLCYPVPGLGKSVLEGVTGHAFSNDDWVIAGPGAVRGLELLLPNAKLSGGRDDEAIAKLVRMQREPLERLHMHWLRDRRNDPILVDRSNMQNCLCEFSKYMRLRAGADAGRKRSFAAEHSYAADMQAATSSNVSSSGSGTAVFLDHAIQLDLTDS